MSEDWPEELSLDDGAGPAPYLSPAARDAMLEGVLAQAYPARRRGVWLAAAIALACIGGGSASAAVYWYARSHSEPVQAPPRPQPVEARRVEAPRAPAPVAPPIVAPAADEPAAVERAASRAPEDWLREGNRLRSARRWKRADQAYSQAAQHAPRDAAYVAFVASAGVRLEHLHDARGALRHYRAALAASPHGPLDEEIRFGIADAYRALGDTAREQEALASFLREHPESPHAEQARARLGGRAY
jgi:tetratricopeptide (TPR) repeat protein